LDIAADRLALEVSDLFQYLFVGVMNWEADLFFILDLSIRNFLGLYKIKNGAYFEDQFFCHNFCVYCISIYYLLTPSNKRKKMRNSKFLSGLTQEKEDLKFIDTKLLKFQTIFETIVLLIQDSNELIQKNFTCWLNIHKSITEYTQDDLYHLTRVQSINLEPLARD
jgi:hypothetical protein